MRKELSSKPKLLILNLSLLIAKYFINTIPENRNNYNGDHCIDHIVGKHLKNLNGCINHLVIRLNIEIRLASTKTKTKSRMKLCRTNCKSNKPNILFHKLFNGQPNNKRADSNENTINKKHIINLNRVIASRGARGEG